MKNHLETIRVLNEQQTENQATAAELADKCEKLSVGIEVFSKARRVLARKIKKLRLQGQTINQKLQWEINQLQKLQEKATQGFTEEAIRSSKKKG